MIDETRINRIILEILTSDPRNSEHKEKVKEYKKELKNLNLNVKFTVNDITIEHDKTYKRIRFDKSGSKYYPQWDKIVLGCERQFSRERSFNIWNKINYFSYLTTPYNRDKNYGAYYFQGLREYDGFRIGSKYNPTTEEYDIYSYINNKITNFFNIKADRDNYGKNSATHEVKAIKTYEENMRLSKHYADKEKEYQEKLDKMLRRNKHE